MSKLRIYITIVTLFFRSIYLLCNIISSIRSFSLSNVKDIIKHGIMWIWTWFGVGVVHLHDEVDALFAVSGELLVELVLEFWAVDADGGLGLTKQVPVSHLQHTAIIKALLGGNIWLHWKLLLWVILVTDILLH